MARTKRLVLGVALLTVAGSGCKDDDDPPDGPGFPVSVYTRNLYLGSDITPLVAIPSPAAVPTVAAALWANVQASNFPERAKVLADEIIALSPDLVALQEVTLYRRQVPSDRQGQNATEVVLDFLEVLMAEIAARGGGYRVAGEATNVDAELPVAEGDAEFDLRLTDRDVILAKDSVQTANFAAFPFAAKFSFIAGGSGGVPIDLTRSWSRLDATVGEAHFTFANSHLEIQSLQAVQTAQATEMLTGIASVPDPVLLLGDFNSEPAMNSYPLLMTQFHDAWDDAGGGAPGLTCCQAGNLMNLESTADGRIDLVLYRGQFRINDIAVKGTDPATSRTPGGLWPSDHFGVFSRVELVP
jgi:endonuclease/exonuclease/phosphatase family metal-dependent hydrolase